MTKLLNEAFSRASQLGEDDQDALARWIMSEITGEKRWAQLLTASQDQLAGLAAEALAEHRRGESREMKPSKL